MTRQCIERGCDEPAGTRWSPYWCERHDEERRDRISASLDSMLAAPQPGEQEERADG